MCLSVCMYVYVCVYLYVCICLYVSVCMYLYVCICLHVSMYACLCVYIYVCMSVCLPVCVSVCLSVCTYIHMYARMYVCIKRINCCRGVVVWETSLRGLSYSSPGVYHKNPFFEFANPGEIKRMDMIQSLFPAPSTCDPKLS